MSQCVPNWDLDNGVDPRNPNSTANTNIHAPMSDYVVSELTWEKDHPSKHGFHGRPSRRAAKLPQRRPPPGDDPAWEKHPANYTLEAVVDQATRAIIPAAVDALVPSTKPQDQVDHLPAARVVPDVSGVRPSGGGGGGTGGGRKRPRPGATGEGYSRSATGSATSAGLAFDSRDINADGGEDAGFATSNPHLEDSPETDHASCGRALTAVSEEDDSCYSRRLSQKYESDEERKTDKYEKERSTTSTKRNRTAAVHNQSERKRRDRINQRMRTLQKLVPNSIKNDKASILDEVIDYMKQLQAQVQMMNRMNSMSPMMMPIAMQQMQMAMMAQMAQMAQMGMVMGMGLPDMGQLPGMPWGTAVPSFLPLTLKRDIAGRDQQGQMSPAAGAAAGAAPFPPDPFAVFMALQTQQPMPMDAHNKMAALCHQPPQQAAPPAPTNETQGGTSGKV